MSKESSLIFLGILVVVVPFLGFPESFRTLLLVLSGLSVSFLALLIYARERLLEQGRIKRRARNGVSRQGNARIRPHAPSEEPAVNQE